MNKMLMLWLLSPMLGMASTAVGGTAAAMNPLMLMALMGGRMNTNTMLMLYMMGAFGGNGSGVTALSTTGGASSLLPLMLLAGSGSRRRYSRRSKPQRVYVNTRRY